MKTSLSDQLSRHCSDCGAVNLLTYHPTGLYSRWHGDEWYRGRCTCPNGHGYTQLRDDWAFGEDRPATLFYLDELLALGFQKPAAVVVPDPPEPLRWTDRQMNRLMVGAMALGLLAGFLAGGIVAFALLQ